MQAGRCEKLHQKTQGSRNLYKEGKSMKAGVIFTGTGPILILTSYGSLNDPKLVEKLRVKGLTKLIMAEVSLDLVKRLYGNHFNVVMGDLKQTDDLRVLDYNGHNVFYNFKFSDLGEFVYHETPEE
jgi:hypothetical protein